MTPAVIDLPVPGLVVLIGAAGAGKTTLAARLFAPSEILSSDDLRATVSGDPADQRATRRAFAILHREAARRLAAGRLVAVDATNAERFARAALQRIAGSAAVPAIAIAIAAPPADVHARNAGRADRSVPASVVDRHIARIGRLGADPETIGAALVAEGFAAAHVLRATVDLDTATIRRLASPPTAGDGSVARP
jgi:predicted kinase